MLSHLMSAFSFISAGLRNILFDGEGWSKESNLFIPGIAKAQAEYEYLSGILCSRFLNCKGV